MKNKTIEPAQYEESGILPVLKSIDRANFMVDLENSLDQIVVATQETGKAGKLSIEIEITPNEKTGAIEVSGGIKVKLPQPNRKAAIFYVTPDNKLTRRDPRQLDMLPEGATIRFK